jgi:hypothetical protein
MSQIGDSQKLRRFGGVDECGAQNKMDLIDKSCAAR